MKKANNNYTTDEGRRVKSASRTLRAKPLAISILVVAGSLALGSCGTKSAPEDIAAKVGSNTITMDQVNSQVKQQLDSAGGTPAPLTPAELVSAQLSVLDNLIQTEALFLKAQEEKLVPDDSKVTEAIQKKKQDSNLTEDDFEKQLKQAGLDDSLYREQVKRDLAITALRDKEKARVKAPTDDDIRKYFQDHKTDFVAERGADISVIVTAPAQNGTPDDAVGDVAAEQKIRALYQQLKSGSDFATVAQQRSEDPSTALRGGELGFGSETQLKQVFATRPEIPTRLMSMDAGQFTEPIKDNVSGRWYIIKLNGKREQAQPLRFEDANVRQSIVDRINQQRQQALLNALIMTTLAETSVKNYLADRIVNNPDTMVMMKPSKLIEDIKPVVQPTPHIEDQGTSFAGGAAGKGGATGNKAGFAK
ncbi:MAG TPA: SurA N-terminal domain-containing protein [Blastocatellia bacterium]|nr:SurA N-terminal domain-containing protein [Blastocatellia bacterium]